ncbi:MAG: molybdopterin-dependent oxidoreductase [Planctomycetaceae bacterium]
MPTCYINNEPVEIGAEERLNCIQAAQKVGVEIPAYCWHPALSVVASCRMCLVEVGDKKPDGTVVMQPKLVPGCQTPVKDGTVIIEDSPKVKAARQATLEYLLLNHPLDCPTCDQAGECFLQDYSFRYGRGYSRLQEDKNIKPDKDHIGENITLFTDRCIMCSRCVRFTREVTGTAELQVVGRGSHEEIDIFPGEPCDNKLAGNVVDLCPVGALCSKDFLYKQRVWWLKTAKSVCPGCSTGCSIYVDQNEEHLYRLRPRVNPEAQGHFMCDEGRFGWKYIHSEQRLVAPEQRREGRVVSRDWDTVYAGIRADLKQIGESASDRVAAVLSPWMTVEEAWLLASFIRSVAPTATLSLGPVRVQGEDDQYPKDIHGRPEKNVKFTIRAEKCPNRLGVQAVLRYFGQQTATFDEVFTRAANGKLDAVYLVGGDPEGWITPEQANRLKSVRTVIVQDLLDSPAIPAATYILAGGAFAEREGTVVNHAGLAQHMEKSTRAQGAARGDGRLLWELTGRPGLFNLKALRKEIAESCAELSALAEGILPVQGVKLPWA